MGFVVLGGGVGVASHSVGLGIFIHQGIIVVQPKITPHFVGLGIFMK